MHFIVLSFHCRDCFTCSVLVAHSHITDRQYVVAAVLLFFVALAICWNDKPSEDTSYLASGMVSVVLPALKGGDSHFTELNQRR